MKTNTLLLLAIFMSNLLSFQTLQAQDTKDIYVSVNTLLNGVPGYAKDFQSLDSLKKVYEQDIQTKDQSIKMRFSNLLKPYNLQNNESIDIVKKRMSSADTIRLKMLVNESDLLENTLKSYENLLVLQEEKTTKKVENLVKEVLTVYAQEMKVHTIKNLDSASLLFLDEDLDHTENVLEEVLKKIKPI